MKHSTAAALCSEQQSGLNKTVVQPTVNIIHFKVMVGAGHPEADEAQHCSCTLFRTTQSGVNKMVVQPTVNIIHFRVMVGAGHPEADEAQH